MTAQAAVSVTDSSGSTIAINRYSLRSEIFVRVEGDNVWLGFNQAAVANKGVFLKAGEPTVIGGIYATSDIYAVCATGESGTLYADA